jgi:hypothetical protein
MMPGGTGSRGKSEQLIKVCAVGAQIPIDEPHSLKRSLYHALILSRSSRF